MDNLETKTAPKELSDEDIEKLKQQDTRLVSQFKRLDLETNASKYWDLFYKRNETNFFKDRHWTTREFDELLGNSNELKVIFEVGCGVGNLIYPLLKEKRNFKFIACDLSQRAVDFVKQHELYSEDSIDAFQADITQESIIDLIGPEKADIATMIFVLSAINPLKFNDALRNVWKVLKPGGIVAFRDYGLYDMAQLRFKAGHKIEENFYMRQDGTRCYYFSTLLLKQLFTQSGFEIITLEYIHRRTVNKKENLDVPRIFVQGKLKKIQDG